MVEVNESKSAFGPGHSLILVACAGTYHDKLVRLVLDRLGLPYLDADSTSSVSSKLSRYAASWFAYCDTEWEYALAELEPYGRFFFIDYDGTGNLGLEPDISFRYLLYEPKQEQLLTRAIQAWLTGRLP